MKVLLDHDVPAQLRLHLPGNLTLTARAMSWDRLENGALLTAAQAAGFDVMVTGDQRLSYQQNHSLRTMALVVITETKRRLVLENVAAIQYAIARATPGGYERVFLPRQTQGIRAIE